MQVQLPKNIYLQKVLPFCQQSENNRLIVCDMDNPFHSNIKVLLSYEESETHVNLLFFFLEKFYT